MKSIVACILSLFASTTLAGDLFSTKYSGPVLVNWQSPDGSEDRNITDLETIKKFDGLIYNDSSTGKPEELSVYLQDGEDTSHLYKKGVRGGILKYEYISSKKQLWVSITFSSPKKLTDREIQDLGNLCQGQWYDGAGSSFAGEIADQYNGTAPLGHPTDIYITQTP